jgi:hypothetical protein
MKTSRSIAIRCTTLSVTLLALLSHATAQSKSDQDVCSQPNPAQMCTAANTCGSASTPCTVDVKRTADAASATPSIPNAKGNSLFCVKVGTTVKWITTDKGTGFVVDPGASSPFDPAETIMGGSSRPVSVVAKRPACLKYSAGACKSGAIYGMCGNSDTELIVTSAN